MRAGTLLAAGLIGVLFATAAQALTQSRTPSACASNGAIGTEPWQNPGNATTSNDVRASAPLTGAETSNYLVCTNYGFSIPFGSVINGITVDVERRTSSVAAGGSRDAAMRIVQGGLIGAADRATATLYTTADVTEAHGGAADLWGLAWTHSDINAANFGAAFAARKNNPAQTHTISVDVISITVDYTPPPRVVSINRANPTPTALPAVDWTVTFTEPVSGVDVTDFALAVSGLGGTSIVSVTGGPTVYTVTANAGTGIGTLGLNLVDDDSILNAATLPLASLSSADGGFTGQVYDVNRPPPVSSFDVVEPGGSPLTGRIFTKIAGQDIAVDILALDASNAVSASFTGAVIVELVDNTSGGACAGLPLIKALANQTFAAADNGRHPLDAGQFEAEARRNVRFRIRYPVAAPTVIACSSDAFAIRPHSFASVQARDQDRTAAGTTRVLGNTADPGSGTVHNAGRPFRIDATARNGAAVPATTALYAPDAGQPVAVLSDCGVAAACVSTPGTLSLGAWGVAAGVITTTTASYNDVGAFSLELEDQTFAAVDAGDGTSTAVRYIRSAAMLTVGRFVPDHFAVTAASITPRSDIAACSGSSFTYMDERMDLVFTLRARAFGGADTALYEGPLGALTLNSAASYDFGAIDSAGPTPLNGVRLDVSLIPGIGATWSAGAAAIAAPIAIARAAAPDGPYSSVRIGIAPVDPDGVALAALDLDADNSGSNERGQVGAVTAVRFGRLRLENAVGSQNLDLPIPIQLEYWNGQSFVVNTADTCTTISAANIAFSSYQGGIDNTNVNAANLAPATIVFSGPNPGVGSLTLTKPLPAPASPGAVTLTVNLAAEAKSYLKGNWGVPAYTEDPRSRAAFGLYAGQPGSFIYFRENY